MTNPTQEQIDQILDKLVRDTTAAVHALYMGSTGGNTQRVKTEVGRNEARQALAQLLGITLQRGTGSAPPPRTSTAMPGAPAGALSGEGRALGAAAGSTLSQGEVDAIRKCIMAWLPMGAPSSAAPDSRCVAAGRELLPTWGEREMAREGAKKIAS